MSFAVWCARLVAVSLMRTGVIDATVWAWAGGESAKLLALP
ncbi:hypothetical protein [Streptomyces sp. NPDC052036]